MSIQQLLKQREIEQPLKKFKKDLENSGGNFLTGLFKSRKFKSGVAELGLELLRKNNDYTEQIILGSKQAQKFKELIVPDVWENEDYYALLVYFFGQERAVLVKQAWNIMPLKMYQTGYERRSFRAPNNERFALLNRVNFLRTVLTAPSTHNHSTNSRVYYNLSLEEQIRYDNELTQNEYVYLIWSMALDSGDERLYQLMEDIIFNRDEQGKITRNIIKALLNSENQKNWQLVEKLLLSAQRQEGLRQTILEALDETSIGALKYMIGVILDNKLTRFSSVVRAIDTWTGLGWSAEKETTVRQTLEMAKGFLIDPLTIKTGIDSKNTSEVYMALWAQGVLDIDQTKPYLHHLLENGTIEKKCVTLHFAQELEDPYIEMPLYYQALNNENLQVLAFALPGMESLLSANEKSQVYINNPDYVGFFEKLYKLAQGIDVKEKSFAGKVFSWLTVKFDKNSLYRCMTHLVGNDQQKFALILNHFEEFSIDLRESITRSVMKDFYSYSFHYGTEADKLKVPTDFQKQFALRILKDRGESMLASAIKVLSRVTLDAEDLLLFQELLKRKSSGLRKNLMILILKQKDKAVIPLMDNLVQNGDVEQRSASLELMLQFRRNDRMNKETALWISLFHEKTKISEKEQKLLDQLQPQKEQILLSAQNGYLLYDPSKKTPFSLPALNRDGLYSQLTKTNKYGFSLPISQIEKLLENLYQIYLQHADYEYESEDYDGSQRKLLLGNGITHLKFKTENLSPLELFENYPLHEIWDQWYSQSGLNASDLYLFTLVESCDRKGVREVLENVVFYYKNSIPNPNNSYYSWNNPVLKILNILKVKYVFEEKNDFLIDATIKLFSSLPNRILQLEQKPERGYYYTFENGNGWQELRIFDVFLDDIELKKLSKEQIGKVWNIYRWRQFNGLPENILKSKPPLYCYSKAFEQQFITEDELYEGMLEPERLSILTGRSRHYRHYGSEDLVNDFPFLETFIHSITESFLDVELKRGETSTPVSPFVQSFQRIYGINRFTELLTGLGKSNLYKGYIYSWSNSELNKQQLFSVLLKRCFPKKEDTQELFNEWVSKEKISELRLIQAAIYAPQWQGFISSYLGWKGLDSAIWWMHAHTKNSDYTEQNSELESEVAKYSAVDLQDFKDGAVDKAWFENAYKELGKAKWEMLYDSAKYVTDGNGHRRARLYADTLTGELKIREVTAKVKDKRDQDYLRVYGLVPLSKTNPEKDVLARYEYLLQFKKESREYGSMRQTSEALAIRVAMENLARNAGYADPIRLTWAMETKQVQTILSKETQADLEGVTVGLIIDEEGKAEVVTFNGEKQLKTIPVKIKKHPVVLEMLKSRKMLREQFNRSRKGLEEAMVRGDKFSFAEISNLFDHPVISKHLEKLLFVSDDTIGFYKDGKLSDGSMSEVVLTEESSLRIAHCVDFHRLNVWSYFQQWCFDHKLKQPFKQVFRELYIPTPDELAEKSVSRRYAGHQVHPKQTLALLKTRGWKVDYEEGLQKVFHKEGLQVKLYAMANWFSPSDVESPTLETIEFHSLKDGKNVPFEEINPRIFSETMRDVDLVVSVAHVGGVDPEMSHSSIEMRAALLRETLRLFKLSNVEIIGSHAKIKGSMADYSVHLGSATVHQIPGNYLSILPVHSQHRGRLFLPFADDDPRSAEVLSKVLLLAKDKDIQDPTILTQINRH